MTNSLIRKEALKQRLANACIKSKRFETIVWKRGWEVVFDFHKITLRRRTC